MPHVAYSVRVNPLAEPAAEEGCAMEKEGEETPETAGDSEAGGRNRKTNEEEE